MDNVTIIIIIAAALPVLAGLIAIGYGVSFIVRILRQIRRQKAADDASSVQTAEVRIVSKRTKVGGYSSLNMISSMSASYYCTFEFADGTRHEFYLVGTEFGLLAEGDTGLLTFQGSRYKGFQRQNIAAATAAAS